MQGLVWSFGVMPLLRDRKRYQSTLGFNLQIHKELGTRFLRPTASQIGRATDLPRTTHRGQKSSRLCRSYPALGRHTLGDKAPEGIVRNVDRPALTDSEDLVVLQRDAHQRLRRSIGAHLRRLVA